MSLVAEMVSEVLFALKRVCLDGVPRAEVSETAERAVVALREQAAELARLRRFEAVVFADHEDAYFAALGKVHGPLPSDPEAEDPMGSPAVPGGDLCTGYIPEGGDVNEILAEPYDGHLEPGEVSLWQGVGNVGAPFYAARVALARPQGDETEWETDIHYFRSLTKANAAWAHSAARLDDLTEAAAHV